MASTSSTSRPSSRGAFELHVESVRATRGLPHLVQPQPPVAAYTPASATTTPASPPPQYVVSALPSLTYSNNKYDDEKSSFERDSDAGSISTMTIGDAKSSEKRTPSGNNNRTTTDDGPEPKTLARALFLYGFLMPLFWCIGTSILFLDLAYHQTEQELAEDARTPEERIADLRVLRAAEVRWAWRSLYALVSLVLVVVITLLVWAGATGRFTGIH